jgi:hypothetical protein
MRQFVGISVAWGWLPLLGVLLWTGLLDRLVPPSQFTTGFVLGHRGQWDRMIQFGFYKIALGCMLPFGLGVLGCAGLVFAMRAQQTKMDGRIKWAILSSNLIYFVSVIRTVSELQYFLPMLAWCVVAAGFGFNLLLNEMRESAVWRAALGVILIIHILIALAFTIDLKTSRVPNFSAVERAAELLPPEARVAVQYRYYGASPTVWLNRNTLVVGEPTDVAGRFAALRKFGFTHVLILDIASLHDGQGAQGPLAWVGGFFHALRKTPPLTGPNFSGYTGLANPVRQYCDTNFTSLLDAPNLRLYSMTSPPATQPKPALR